MSTTACARCGRIAPLTLHGPLNLCTPCIASLTPGCGEFQHDYRAAPGETPGGWICLRCGATLASQEIVIIEPTLIGLDAADC